LQNATYGIYKNGQIIFDGPDININNSRILVVFLDEEPRESKLMDFLNYMGHGKIHVILKPLSLIYEFEYIRDKL
jgi:hypothetical protein